MRAIGELPTSPAGRDHDVGPVPACGRIGQVGLRELLVAWLLLGLLGVLAFAPHALGGGFYLDDWANGVGSIYPPSGGFGGALSYFEQLTMYRPVLVLYVPLTYLVFGMHMGLHLAWAAGLGIVASGLLFGILRTVGLARTHAWLLAALVLIYPWFDATRMWATASQVTLGIVFALAGIWLALAALRRRSLPLHAASLLFYVLSILSYEIALPLIGLAGVLYVALVGWRAARLRWGVDVVLALAGAVWVGTQTTRVSSGLSADLTHLKDILTTGGTMLGRTGLPNGPQRTTLVLIVLGALAAVAVAFWRRDRTAAPGTSMVPWLLLGGAGLVVAAAGWLLFIPADPYYTPSTFGITNRVNGLAGFGLVMIVYAAAGVIGSLLGRLSARPATVAAAVTVAIAVALGVAYKSTLERHTDIWNMAFRAEMAGLGQMKSQFPTLPNGTTVFTSGYPAYQTLGVPIFSTTWDVNGAIKLQYKNPTLSAYPILPGTRLVCGPAGIGLTGPGYPAVTRPFGTVRFLDVGSGRTATPRDVRECRRAAPTFVPGPLYLFYLY
jgi:hypothetical protein